MLIVYDSTHLFFEDIMISIKNTYDFSKKFINMFIETATTGHPSMISIGARNQVYHIILGYNNSFAVRINESGMTVHYNNMEFSEFAGALISQGESIVSFMDTPEKKKNIRKLLHELEVIMESTTDIYINYEIRRKTIDSLLYTHENKKNYCIIYDELDDLSEAYRVITKAGSYVIYISPVSVDITLLKADLSTFTNDIYVALKESDNVYIKKQNRKIKKYVSMQGT